MGFFFSKTRQVDFLSPFYYKRDSKYTLYMGGYIDCNKKKHDVPHGFYQSPLCVSLKKTVTVIQTT